ncbi:hypothetical protein [Flavobacterium sp.]|uniref:hypothetical protein n=1 Tax=Flavobacterium sp. TaxID=239 RepID=UPI0025D21930|nr:hypothetical protein [Flavobacterium sp.]
MEKLKTNWKLVIYWFVSMSLMNVYIIPKFINDEPITNKRIIIGVVVSLIISLIMGTLITPKSEDK